MTGDSDLDRRSVEVLLEAIARVSESRDLDALLVSIVDRSIEITGAERGLLILDDSPEVAELGVRGNAGESGLHLRVARSREGQDLGEGPRFSTSIVRRVLEQGEPVRATVQSDSDALELGRSVFDLKLRAVMCVPLTKPKGSGSASSAEVRAGAARGVLYVDSKAATREFGPRDLGLFAALSHQISLALENARLHLLAIDKMRLEHSLELASAIQSGLMPQIPRDFTGIDVHGWYRPAERTSGDFYDFVKTRDKRLAVVIGDVTGHGFGPAIITASAQSSLRAYLRALPDPSSAVTELNRDLSERLDSGMFVTLLMLVLDPGGSCEVYNAGHHAPLLWRKRTGVIEELAGHGVALGMIPDEAYKVGRTDQLEAGDVLLAFTDGLIEAPSAANRDELFGEERAWELFASLCARGETSEGITRVLAEAAFQFSGGVHEDDITLVVVRRT
jgi:phosphoserine phosphatase RsbU/P